MKVIKKGNINENKTHKTTCPNCTAVLEYLNEDVHSYLTSYNEDVKYVLCPECSERIVHKGRQQLNG